MKIGKKLLNMVGTVAPMLATSMGGPLANIAINTIAKRMGVDATPQAVQTRLDAGDANDLLAIKECEAEFEVKMKELELDETRLLVEDTQDARSRFSKDWTTRIMGIATLSGFLAYIFLVTLQPPEQNSEALINLVLGYLGGLASAVISFYFGASNAGGSDD